MFEKVYLFAFFVTSICSPTVFSQNFVRAEVYTGLNILEDNNGVAVADYDNDNDLDIFVVAKRQEREGFERSFSRLFRNENNGRFTDVTVQSGLTNLFVEDVDDGIDFFGLDGFKYSVSWGDYNNDGYPDIFFTYAHKVQLFTNNGNGTFTDVTQSSGIVQNNGCNNTGATWFDFDNDGYLDLYINSWGLCYNNTLYRNNGNGTFTDVTINTGLKLDLARRSYMMVPFDFNDDGYLDMYVSNDLSDVNYLFINQNGESFIDQADAFALGSRANVNDMSIAISDYENDGDFDVFTSGVDENSLFENDGNGMFTMVSPQKNIMKSGWSWGSNFSDFDLDGDEDLFVANGYYFVEAQPNTYYKNLTIEGNNTFVDDSANSGLAEITRSTEATDFDYDNDGDLDIFVTNQKQPSFFYENKLIDTGQPDNLNWLRVQLQGTVSNRDAIGSTVTVSTSSGVYNRYYSGVGFLSQNLQPVHFGLGNATQVLELKIKWPSGLIETYPNLNSNTFIKVIEGQGYEVLNIMPSAKIFGCTDPKSCSYNPDATFNDGSTCTYIETKPIEGPSSSGINKIETYTYPISATGSANWSVEGGHIIDGHGTAQITVQWGLESSGKITVIEVGTGCISEPQELEVPLNVNNAPDHVSIARIWNEALLEAIRNDFARPTVHARNLFHTSIALYDAWAIISDNAKTYLIGKQVNGFLRSFKGFSTTERTEVAQRKAISYAAYRLLSQRFKNSPGAQETLERFDLIMQQLGYDTSYDSIDYSNGSAEALGNFIAKTIIDYGNMDGSNESDQYNNLIYKPLNPPLKLSVPEEPIGIIDPNRWQPLSFNTFIDQSGNLIAGSTPDFLGPEWGNVFPFALEKSDKIAHQRDGNDYNVYSDPGTPPYLSISEHTTSSDLYKWNFSLVSVWSSHLDPSDAIMWDISPKSIGNIDIESIPESFSDHHTFYNLIDGGDISKGHQLNPVTGQPYETQMVPRADYARVLAEFWADGPDSETPPGHWFTILNYVNDHPLFEKKFNGEGASLDALEWDVKAYFILGGAMHDAAVTAWSIKGWHDYVRPISAIRYMAELGQSTDQSLPNYHIGGLPLINGYIELVKEGDILAGKNNENINKIKVLAWKGHEFIQNSETDVAGVGWILAKNWWPYQRPSFVTPPFAGYISGHSTFSRAAAEVLTLLTGDEFFPGGMGEFVAKKDEFLVFEKGPSVDVRLQWATYRDASDQTSLSRIWGGIHPPADDLPGRLIGEKIGINAFNYALPYFSKNEHTEEVKDMVFYPNPIENNELYISNTSEMDDIMLFDIQGRLINVLNKSFDETNNITTIRLSSNLTSGLYIIKARNISKTIIIK
ncbi:FG-GAP-like repeat-containing protein [Flavivirga rizhaonensis]|uniref:T9SS type A sorting domain-containing protein n=1 Tax=Flavivirga rizhaonensis TaxID=2559571 RepID=A0A4S1DSG4_9FLAO|nr:FG-GAP-like repeat-containing protein [Flavivirga rizhaonensis]TGV00960.1 T9SS type A sorting domain-containing protein [Flavivirga rizhaonensis]